MKKIFEEGSHPMYKMLPLSWIKEDCKLALGFGNMEIMKILIKTFLGEQC